MRVRIEVVSGADRGRAAESKDAPLRIGRAATNQLVLTEWHVSGEHASVLPSAEGWVVRDHHSTNGTRIRRGSEVLEVGDGIVREVLLEPGDVILLGDREQSVEIAIEIEDEETARIVEVRHVADLEKVEAEALGSREVLQQLYSAQKAIGAAMELDSLVDATAKEIFKLLSRATHVTVALRESEDEGPQRSRYVPVGSRQRDGEGSSETIPITRSVFKKVVAERAAVLAADARQDVGETASIMGAQILSTMGVPLWQGKDIIGVVQVDNRASRGMFRAQDLDILAVLAQAASQAFAHARLLQRLRVAEDRQRKENTYLKRREEKRRFDGIIGESAAMRAVFGQLHKVVDTRVTVLIEGETGTGKELVASAVHYWSNRKEKLFVAQNCAALPENLLESELFGHRKGAFTGATDDKKGLFELADQGTLFLDEVTEMPLSLQAKLLRALQEGEVRPVGSNVTRKVDVRIVAATNRDLEKEVKEGRFREDLFYRLRVFPIRVPPLRERPEDVPLLATHFLKRYGQEFGRSIGGFSQEAMNVLKAYKWSGNVRELENEVQRLVIQLDDGAFIEPDHLSPRIRQVENLMDRVQLARGTLKEMVDQVERRILLEALKDHNNNKSATAKTLGITREGLHKKLKGFGIS